jgi:hypothetical protein
LGSLQKTKKSCYQTKKKIPLINVDIIWWQSLTPVLKLSVLKQRLFLLVSITSTNDGSYPFIKHVGLLTMQDTI